MSDSPYTQPIAAIATLLDCLRASKDISPYFSVIRNSTPWMQYIDSLAEHTDTLLRADIPDGTFFCGLNGHGYQSVRLDVLFSSQKLKLAVSQNWIPVFPLDEERYKLHNEQLQCVLDAIMLIFTIVKDGLGDMPDIGTDTRLVTVCLNGMSDFKLLDVDGTTLKAGNWLKLVDIFEENEEAENGLVRIWG